MARQIITSESSRGCAALRCINSARVHVLCTGQKNGWQKKRMAEECVGTNMVGRKIRFGGGVWPGGERDGKSGVWKIFVRSISRGETPRQGAPHHLPEPQGLKARHIKLNNYIEKSIVFAKIFKLRVGSVCQYLLLWQRVVRSPQCGLRSVTLDSLPGTKYGDRH